MNGLIFKGNNSMYDVRANDDWLSLNNEVIDIIKYRQLYYNANMVE